MVQSQVGARLQRFRWDAPMSRTLALTAALLLAGSPALAQSAPQGPGPGNRGNENVLRIQKLTPEQQRKLFPGRKALLLQEQKERIAILQRSQNCVSRAANPDALRSCTKQERSEYQALRNRVRNDMRQLFVSNGIPFPQMPPRRAEPAGRGAAESI